MLRTIDKSGGLDEYLIKDKAGRIKELGMKGWELRWRVMNSPWWKDRCRKEYERMGMGALIGEIEAIKQELYVDAREAVTELSVVDGHLAAVDEVAAIEEPVPQQWDLLTSKTA